MSKEKVSRRGYIKYAGAGIVIVAVAGAGAYYTTRPREKKTISVLDWSTPWTDKLKELTEKEFTPQTGIEVTFDTPPWGSYIEKNLMNIRAEKSSYDVINNNTEWTMPAWVYADKLINLKQYDVRIDDYLPAALALVMFPSGQKVKPKGMFWDFQNGDLYGVPYWCDSTPLLYRKDLFADEGISSPPTNWDDFLTDAQKLTKEDRYGYVFQGTPQAGQLADAWWIFMHSWGADVIDENLKPAFNTTEGIEATQFLVDLYQKHKVVPPGVPTYDHQGIVDTYQGGIAAMFTPWANGTGGIAGSPVGPMTESTITPIKKRIAARLAGCAHTIPNTSANPDAAWEWIKWAQSEEIRKIVITEIGLEAVFKNELEILQEGTPAYAVAEIASRNDVGANPSIPNLVEVSDAYSPHLSDALTGKISVEEALNKAETAVLDVMQETG